MRERDEYDTDCDFCEACDECLDCGDCYCDCFDEEEDDDDGLDE